MAEEKAQTARKRPGAKKESAKTKAGSQYHIYTSDENGTLSHVQQVTARNAEHAVAVFIGAPGEHADLAEQVSKGEAGLTVIPERNISRVKAQVETRTRVKLSVA